MRAEKNTLMKTGNTHVAQRISKQWMFYTNVNEYKMPNCSLLPTHNIKILHG